MITRKVHSASLTAKAWILTPETSPQLSPLNSDWDADDEEAKMSTEDLLASRPIRIASPSREVPPSSSRPTLDEILNGRSQPPYTLSAFTAYLSQQHCLETLEFTMAAKQYRDKYTKTTTHFAGRPMRKEHSAVQDLQQDWIRILDVYIKPGSPREINLPAEERDDLLDQIYSERPPGPEALEPSVKRMFDLMEDSIFMPFLNSLNPTVRPKTFSAPGSDFGGRREGKPDLSTSLFEETGDFLLRRHSRRRPSPPSSGGIDFSAPKSPPLSASHAYTQSSSITSALGRTSAPRISTHISSSSAASAPEAALTDESGSGDSPSASDPMTPPTTPPSSDIPMGPSQSQLSPKSTRSDSGSWRMMKAKLWGKKKSGGTLREQPEEG